MTYPCPLYEVKDAIATLTLDRHDRLNALGEFETFAQNICFQSFVEKRAPVFRGE
jgi:hypothetical protein